MASTKTCLTALLLSSLLLPLQSWGSPSPADDQAALDAKASEAVDALDASLYNALSERYLLEEVRTLRQRIADLRVEAAEKIVDREIMVASTAVRYATDTVTYFLYLIAGAST